MKRVFKCIISFFILFTSLIINTRAQDSFNVMAYNIWRYPSAGPANREINLAEILKKTTPDILIVGELESEIGADIILARSFNVIDDGYDRADFVYNTSDSTDTLQQLIFYNNRKFILLAQKVWQTTVRDINQYTLMLNTTDKEIDTTFIHVFAVHLKSSTGNANINLRYGMIDTFIKVINALPPHHHIILGGDLNFYKSTEIGYQHLIDTTNRTHIMIDPLGNLSGNWQDNPNYAFAHTQSTRLSTTGFGFYSASGGVDDRFDFIILSHNLMDSNHSIYYQPESYIAFGNNGNCLNLAINDPTCNGLYDQNIRNHLHNMSDHLPVLLTVKTNKTFENRNDSSTTSIEEINIKNKLVITSGNIVKDELKLTWKIDDDLQQNSKYITIINTKGQTIKTIQLKEKNGEITIDLSDMQPDMYYIHTECGITAKFIKI